MGGYKRVGGDSGIFKLLVNGNGEVVCVENLQGNPLTINDYHSEENRRIDEGGVLACDNWCRWYYEGGRWI